MKYASRTFSVGDNIPADGFTTFEDPFDAHFSHPLNPNERIVHPLTPPVIGRGNTDHIFRHICHMKANLAARLLRCQTDTMASVREADDFKVRIWCASKGIINVRLYGSPWWFQHDPAKEVTTRNNQQVIKSLWHDLFPCELENLRTNYKTPWQFYWIGQCATIPTPTSSANHPMPCRCRRRLR